MPGRATVAVALLLLLALISQATLVADLPWEDARRGDNDVAADERRLDAVRGQLPRRGGVGYRDERKGDDGIEKARHFFQTQYVLAPLILDPRAKDVPVIVDGEAGVSVSHPEVP